MLLAATAFAPVLLTLAFVNWRMGSPWWYGSSQCCAALLLVLLCHLLLKEVARRGEILSITVESAKPADKEVLAFFLAYLIPLANTFNVGRIDPAVLWFIVALLLFVVFVTNGYQFNPLLTAIFRYHFYEITDHSKVGYVLITRRNIHDVRAIKSVVEITDYVIMEHIDGQRPPSELLRSS